MAKVPKWVKSYPYELDRTALENLAASAQGAFDDPREMNFVLYGFKDQKSLDAACDLIIKKGWHVKTGPGSDDPSKLMIISQKMAYVINQENYETDASMFMHIADLYNAKYDGWFASN